MFKMLMRTISPREIANTFAYSICSLTVGSSEVLRDEEGEFSCKIDVVRGSSSLISCILIS